MARPKLGDSESKRLQMVITEDELKAIENWQFENRVPSKSEAIRRLVQMGLRTDYHLIEVLGTFFGTMEKLMEMEAEWRDLVESYDEKAGLREYAMKLALLFSERFPEVLERGISAHNLAVDLSNELLAILDADNVPDAIVHADEQRKRAAELRKSWAEEDALLAKLKEEKT